MIRTCMENIQDKPVKQARRKLCHPEGGGGGRGGGRVGREKEEKKRVRVRVKVFHQEIINKK